MEIQQLKQEIESLKQEIQSMKSNGTFPYEIRVAIKDSFRDEFVAGGSSAISAATETQAVAEGGTNAYNVAKPMDGFITITFNGNTYNVPYYT